MSDISCIAEDEDNESSVTLQKSQNKVGNEMCSILNHKIPLKSLPCGQMIDLHFVTIFIHKAKWTEIAITHEINCVLEQNIIGYSTVEKYVRMLVLSTRETDSPIVSESEGHFSLDDRIAVVLSEKPFLSVCQIAKKKMAKSTVHRHLT
jgi:hypothetical protein